MMKTHVFDFGTLYLHDDYLIAIMNEGVHIIPEMNSLLVEIANTYYKGRAFVYLTHRIHSYSVDPSIYLQTSKINNLVGFGVVSRVSLALNNAHIEKIFLKKPFETFTNINEAIAWAKSIINSN